MSSENNGKVYMFNNGKALEQSVNIGKEYEHGVEILSGIESNNLIISSVDKINNNQFVTVNKILENNKW